MLTLDHGLVVLNVVILEVLDGEAILHFLGSDRELDNCIRHTLERSQGNIHTSHVVWEVINRALVDLPPFV